MGIQDSSATIESITVTCHAQEDWTGTDQIDFYLQVDPGAELQFLGGVSISNGETKELAVTPFVAHYFDYINAYERDIGLDDYLGVLVVDQGPR